jgi:Zn-dependent peptidase ImmA (M78 family)
MVPNDALCDLIQEQNIQLIVLPMPQKVQGFYSFSDSNPRIALNSNLSESSSKYRCVLAEELGHHYTSIGELPTVAGMPYYNRIQHDRSESRAVRWAINFLIPTEQLLYVIEDYSLSCLQELADAFVVTVEFIQYKLYYMSCTSQYWTLVSGRTLCLASLPSIYIYDPIAGCSD